MINLRILFGMVPKTADYEEKQSALRNEYQELIAFVQSKELADYLNLEKIVTSSEFARKKKAIHDQKFADTPEYKKEKEYQSLKKQTDIKIYYKIKNSEALKEFTEFETSKDLKQYHQLEKYLNSSEYLDVKEYSKLSPKEKFRRSELYESFEKYGQQKHLPRIKNYYKLLNSKAYNDYIRLADSDALLDFEELHNYLQSQEFKKVKHSMGKKEFRASDEFRKLEKYNTLRKSREIRNYKLIVHSVLFTSFQELHGSKELQTFENLERFVNSDEFKADRLKIEKQKFEDTQEYQKLQEFNFLKKSKKFRVNFAFQSSKNYNTYLKLDGSDLIKHYEKLEKYLHSDEFIKVKEYMLLPGKKKVELSDEHKQELKFNEIKNSEKFQWYFKTKDSRKFDEIKRWKLTFEDDFITDKLDKKKWLTRYFWGEALLHDSYSLDYEKNFYTDGKNVELNGGVLKIITKRETINGKAWNPSIGFYPHDFEYTSGLINTGGKFRQQYGLFEAKIRFNKSYPVNHAFWMISDLMLPHIDIAKAAKKITMGNYWGDGAAEGGTRKNVSKVGLSKYGSDFYVFSLEWNENMLIWKINGIPVTSVSEGVPKVPMYVNISSSLYQDVSGSELPATLDVDWVRCYQLV